MRNRRRLSRRAGALRKREILEIAKAVLNQMNKRRGKYLKKQTNGRRTNQLVERQGSMKIECGWGTLLPHFRLRLRPANQATERERKNPMRKPLETMTRILNNLVMSPR